MKRIPLEQKNQFPEVFCIFSNTAVAKIRLFALWEILLLQKWCPGEDLLWSLDGANCSAGNSPPGGNSGLKRTRTDAILKKAIEK
jgi:hypothetical protein